MKKVIMYLEWNYDFGPHWHWHVEQEWPDWEPYWIEIPEDFYLAESNGGDKLYFRKGDDMGHELFISDDSPDGKPVLVGGRPVEMLTLKVIGPVNE